MTDNRMNRVKVMLGGVPGEGGETTEHAMVAPREFPNQALQVLTMAQRTAEEHVATAHHQADKIRTDALAAAEQTAREAEQHAHNVRREADKVLFEARKAAEQTDREAHARAEHAQRNAGQIEAEARARAEAIVGDAHASAEQLKLQAQRRYEDVVGSLGSKRAALQEQIEALEQFDREYRSRLTTFMQGQMRALWVDQPQVTGELDPPGSHAAHETHEAEPPQQQLEAAVVPAQRPGAEDHLQDHPHDHPQAQPGEEQADPEAAVVAPAEDPEAALSGQPER